MNKKNLNNIILASIFILFTLPNVTAQVTKGLIANWSFDDSTFNDQSGHGHDGYVTDSPTNTPGIHGNAKWFNGTSNKFNVPNSPELNIGTRKALSISVWYRSDTSSLDQVGDPIIALANGGSGTNDYSIFNIDWLGKGRKLWWGTGSASDSLTWLKINEPSAHKWHHVVATVKDSFTGFKYIYPKYLYIDGKLIRYVISSIKADSITNDIDIGGWFSTADNANHYFNGAIDEIRMYDRVLTSAEVSLLYNGANNDIGIVTKSPGISVCQGKRPINVTIKNFGNTTIKSATIQYKLNSVLQSAYSWSGSLAPGSSANFDIDTINMKIGISYSIKVWTSSPNGVKDINLKNDTDSYYIYVNSSPKTNAGNKKALCDGDLDTLGTAAVSGNIYLWSSKPAGFYATTARPIILPTNNTTYILKQTDTTTGCSSFDSIKVSVTPLPLAKWSVSLIGSKFLFSPVDSTLSYNWNFGDSASSTLMRPLHSYSKSGIYKISLIATNKNNCSSEFDSTLTIIVTGINNIDLVAPNIFIYPNPTKGRISVSFSNSDNKAFAVSIKNITGTEVTNKIISNNNQVELDMSNLANGFYIIQISNEVGVYTKMLILNK